jgi:hypothetical protein
MTMLKVHMKVDFSEAQMQLMMGIAKAGQAFGLGTNG